MSYQHAVLCEFKEIYDSPTLKQSSKLTGIQLTRIHRLYNGSLMRLDEFEKFEEAIHRKKKGLKVNQFRKVMIECFEVLGPKSLKDIEEYMIDKIELSKMIGNQSQFKTTKYA